MAHPHDIDYMPPGPVANMKPKQMTATVVAACACGSREPVVCPVVPGADAAYQCPDCNVIWRIEKIEYYNPPENSSDEIRVYVKWRATIPSIVGAKKIG
jgi:hypothetical protein